MSKSTAMAAAPQARADADLEVLAVQPTWKIAVVPRAICAVVSSGRCRPHQMFIAF